MHRVVEPANDLPGVPDTPNVQLWRAVLVRAVVDLTGNSAKERGRAEVYFRSEREHVGSFLWICDVLGLDASSIRAKLLSARSRIRIKRQITSSARRQINLAKPKKRTKYVRRQGRGPSSADHAGGDHGGAAGAYRQTPWRLARRIQPGIGDLPGDAAGHDQELPG